MPTAILTDRALISVTGLDAEHLLQNVITPDLDALGPNEAKPGALLSPQGKILFDFLVSRDGPDSLLIECRSDIADDLVRRLSMYRLRAKAQIVKQDQSIVRVWWDADSLASFDDSGASQVQSSQVAEDGAAALRDLRFPGTAVFRTYGGAAGEETGDLAGWHRLRIAEGVAESGTDYALGDAFPHDVLLDQNGGVGLRKGCYVGQEVVSRMQHRGTARRRVLVATSGTALPAPGEEIMAGGRSIGTLGSTAGQSALAVVRIDKVKAAVDAGLPITAGDAALDLAIPVWARFTFPESAPTAEEA